MQSLHLFPLSQASPGAMTPFSDLFLTQRTRHRTKIRGWLLGKRSWAQGPDTILNHRPQISLSFAENREPGLGARPGDPYITRWKKGRRIGNRSRAEDDKRSARSRRSSNLRSQLSP